MIPGAGPVPTLLVAGYLGVGKTTLIAGWLARRPTGQRWAVLVNEFGAIGIDRALLGGGAEVFEVAGGCACCASAVAFRTTLVRLLRRGPWDRLLIETSGLGHPAKLVDRMREPGGCAGRAAARVPGRAAGGGRPTGHSTGRGWRRRRNRSAAKRGRCGPGDCCA
jgi:G3E family GTPase